MVTATYFFLTNFSVDGLWGESASTLMAPFSLHTTSRSRKKNWRIKNKSSPCSQCVDFSLSFFVARVSGGCVVVPSFGHEKKRTSGKRELESCDAIDVNLLLLRREWSLGNRLGELDTSLLNVFFTLFTGPSLDAQTCEKCELGIDDYGRTRGAKYAPAGHKQLDWLNCLFLTLVNTRRNNWSNNGRDHLFMSSGQFH